MVMNNGAAEGVKNTDPQPSRRDLIFLDLLSKIFFVNLKFLSFTKAPPGGPQVSQGGLQELRRFLRRQMIKAFQNLELFSVRYFQI